MWHFSCHFNIKTTITEVYLLMKGKGIIITVVSVIALILAVVFGVQGCQNSAISREEVINQSLEQITTEQNLLFDTLEELGQSVKQGSEQEVAFQTTIAQMRSGESTQSTDNNIQMAIQAVHEAYPAFQSTDLYKDLNNAIKRYNENVAAARKAYSKATKEYRLYCRKFPNRSILSMLGYGIVEYESLYDGSSVKLETKTGKPKMFD